MTKRIRVELEVEDVTAAVWEQHAEYAELDHRFYVDAAEVLSVEDVTPKTLELVMRRELGSVNPDPMEVGEVQFLNGFEWTVVSCVQREETA